METAPTPEVSPDSEIADAYVERERFAAAQKLPRNQAELKAVTPEQKAFVDLVRTRMESDGATWNSERESMYLALALNTCETAILSYHDVSVETLKSHVGTSPIIMGIAESQPEEDRAATIAGLTRSSVDGTYFLCTDDYGSWNNAFYEMYPDFPISKSKTEHGPVEAVDPS